MSNKSNSLEAGVSLKSKIWPGMKLKFSSWIQIWKTSPKGGSAISVATIKSKSLGIMLNFCSIILFKSFISGLFCTGFWRELYYVICKFLFGDDGAMGCQPCWDI